MAGPSPMTETDQRPAKDHPAPTAAQIRAITDIPALEHLRDDLEMRIVRVETDLEFRSDDLEWERRAASALSYLRYAHRIAGRQISNLQAARTPSLRRMPRPPPLRPSGHNSDWTNTALAERAIFPDPEFFTSTDALETTIAHIVAVIDAVSRDRTDEIAQPPMDRDEGFLSATLTVLKDLRSRRASYEIRKGRLTKAARKAAQNTIQETRERLFIDIARETIDRSTHEAIWRRVDQQVGEQPHG